eukprot:gb/GECG01015998.1/.p1 GENE.gb/GECG01015998.1/~~gb/GECG01015998.1/.p1  ORF type:complete len:219 (+),score=9.58 gb/GECG01015998.1/:1-657(+)
MTVPVALFVPNIIGYVRVLTGVLSFPYALHSPWMFLGLYAFSYALDALDGVAARGLNQCSRFGAVLDMVTDRFCTCVLLLILSHLWRDLFPVWAILLSLELVSHWLSMYSSLLLQSGSHKTSVRNPLLRFYYLYPYALFTFCLGNEVFLMSLYGIVMLPNFTIWIPILDRVGIFTTALYLGFPFFFMKQIFSVIQLVESATKIIEVDEQDRKQGKKAT